VERALLQRTPSPQLLRIETIEDDAGDISAKSTCAEIYKNTGLEERKNED
jgi:hypothetical protein